MSGLIPQHFIDELLNRSDIVDVINTRLPLKKKGREYSACCPFHNEKTPSFTVSQVKQFYHCFGCGAHGTAIGFLMEYESLDFVDAVETLAADYQMEVIREDSRQDNQEKADSNNELYSVLEQTSTLYQKQLRTHEPAINYLKQRALSGEIAACYKLGYAPSGWGFLLNELSHCKQQLINNGLVVSRDDNKTYDRFRDRIMFPIRDRRGRTIGFGGRIIDAGDPKYLNSPETPVFHKGRELYGLYEARASNRSLSKLVVVEGYMDVVALAQHGITYAVASLGTATTIEQLKLIFRSTEVCVFCYDGDRAGRQAAWRVMETVLPILRDNYQVRFLLLPEGEDPDTYVRKKGRKEFETMLEEATSLSDFMINSLQEQVNTDNLDGKAKLFDLARPLINKLTDGIYKDMLSDKLSTVIEVDRERLLKRLPQTHERGIVYTESHDKDVKKKAIRNTATREAVAILLQYPDLAANISIPVEFAASQVPGLPLLYSLYSDILKHPGIQPASLLEHWRDTEHIKALNQLMQRNIPGLDEHKVRQQFLSDAIRQLAGQHRKQEL